MAAVSKGQRSYCGAPGKGAFGIVTQGRWPVANSVPDGYCARAPLPTLDTRPTWGSYAVPSDPWRSLPVAFRVSVF